MLHISPSCTKLQDEAAVRGHVQNTEGSQKNTATSFISTQSLQTRGVADEAPVATLAKMVAAPKQEDAPAARPFSRWSLTIGSCGHVPLESSV
jgi:hypothetical protein